MVERERESLGIPPGTIQRARVLDANGKPLFGRRSKRVPRPIALHRPVWDKASGELRLRRHLARKVDVKRAKNGAYILDAFEECGWPESMDDPLRQDAKVDQRMRLTNAVKSLNTGLKYMRFRTEDGQRVCWTTARADG